MKVNFDELQKLVLLFKNKKIEWFVNVLDLHEGQAFGELALLNDQPRAATVKTTRDSTFAILDKKDFQKILGRIENRLIEQKARFFMDMPFLKHWTKTQIHRLIRSFESKSFVRNQVIYNQGDQSSLVYIIQKGEFEITRTRKKVVMSTKKDTNDMNLYSGFVKRNIGQLRGSAANNNGRS